MYAPLKIRKKIKNALGLGVHKFKQPNPITKTRMLAFLFMLKKVNVIV